LTVIEPPALSLVRGRPEVEELIARVDAARAGARSPADAALRFRVALGYPPKEPPPLAGDELLAARASSRERLPQEAEIPLGALRAARLRSLVVRGTWSEAPPDARRVTAAAFHAACDVIEAALGSERAVFAGGRTQPADARGAVQRSTAHLPGRRLTCGGRVFCASSWEWPLNRRPKEVAMSPIEGRYEEENETRTIRPGTHANRELRPPGPMYGYGGWGYWRGFMPRPQYPTETKPFFLTSEFFAPLLLVIAMAISAATNDGFGARWFWTLATVATAAYVISRGIAKAGTKSRAHDPREEVDLFGRREERGRS
jgi:hypothetical protein